MSWVYTYLNTNFSDPNDHGHEPQEVFPVKAGAIDVEALKLKDWDKENWTPYKMVLAGE